jgi:hypothetical protein
MLTESICSGVSPAAEIAALQAAVCNCVDVVFLNAPPNVPNGVRLAATMKIPGPKRRTNVNLRVHGHHERAFANSFIISFRNR